MFEVFLSVNIWSCLCWFGFLLFGCCSPRQCGGGGVSGRECFWGSVADTKEMGESSAERVGGKELSWVHTKRQSSQGIRPT